MLIVARYTLLVWTHAARKKIVLNGFRTIYLSANSVYRYLVTGGSDSIINFFDLQEWLCIRSISTGE